MCTTGSGAGECSIPRGIAADPANGHIFVGDQGNRRMVEFNALGQFVKAWGWDVVASGPGDDTTAPEDQFEICVPREGDVCKAGVSGAGPGQLSLAQGVALDSLGNVYVADHSNRRVQKFDRDGNFLLTFGGEVNKTKVEEGTATEQEENLCPFAPADECKAGVQGAGKGQFGAWQVSSFIAIDRSGTPTDTDDKVYVGDVDRIQRFDNVGAYQGELLLPEAFPGTAVKGLAVDPAGNLYATYSSDGQIHKISSAGAPLTPKAFPIPKLGPFETPVATAVAVDSAGNVFAFGPIGSTEFAGLPRDPIIEFDAEGKVIAEFGKEEFAGSTGLATNLCPGSEAPGNVYATNVSTTNAFLVAYGTEPFGCFKARTFPATSIGETSATLNGTVNPSGVAVAECRFEYGLTSTSGTTEPCEESPAEIGSGTEPVPVHLDIGGLEKGTVYHFRLIAKVGGEVEPGADAEFKTLGPPLIANEHTVSVSDAEATVKALVNPEGFPTSCHAEYGPTASYGQSTSELPLGADRLNHPTVIGLKGLTPGSTYHWRIVCANASGTTPGEDRTISTYRQASSQPQCPNDAFRTGASASLPDCRAYEMVSPVDKNGGDIYREKNGEGDIGSYVQVAADGESITYSANPAFADAQSSFYYNQYIAGRTERGQAGEGWSNTAIRPAVAGHQIEGDDAVFGGIREFIAFSPDLCSAWLVDHQAPPPTAEGQEGVRNLYRRDNCATAAGEFEALVPAPAYLVPPGTSPLYVDAYAVQGYSEDSRHAIFAAQAALTGDAAESNVSTQLYDRFCPVAASLTCREGDPAREGKLALVSVLPDGSSGDPTSGDGMGFADPGGGIVGSGTMHHIYRAVSADGSRVYWSSGGRLYLRLHPEQGIVAGECGEAAAACTVPVSASSATFLTASPDGSRALFTEGGKLFEFDLAGALQEPPQPSQQIASGVKAVLGASEDLARVYFISTAALPGAGQNSEEDEALAGESNLYLAAEGGLGFIGTLVSGDVGQLEPGVTRLAYDLATEGTYELAARITPDGTRIAFDSRAPLTGYDNASVEDGRASVEVFLYEAGGELHCVSCNPGGARPSAKEIKEPYVPPWSLAVTKVPAAAWIPTWEHRLHASNVLSAGGGRLFFNSNDALLLRDTNGAQDVYEWEAPGTGQCDTGEADYFPQNGGCLYLISSGEGPEESEFWEASRDGRDVFFTTDSSLLPRDPGSIDLYDARIGGGFPEPGPPAVCEGEACQSPPAPPDDPTPASSAFQGAGNVSGPSPGRSRCPKGKRRVRRTGKVRCVKRSQKHRTNQKERTVR